MSGGKTETDRSVVLKPLTLYTVVVIKQNEKHNTCITYASPRSVSGHGNSFRFRSDGQNLLANNIIIIIILYVVANKRS